MNNYDCTDKQRILSLNEKYRQGSQAKQQMFRC